MESLVADNAGAILRELLTYPGQVYSLYAIPHPAYDHPEMGPITEPAVGSLAFFHKDAVDCPVIDFDGVPVEFDVAAKPGIAASFIAQSTALLVVGSGFAAEGDGIRFNLVPSRGA